MVKESIPTLLVDISNKIWNNNDINEVKEYIIKEISSSTIENKEHIIQEIASYSSKDNIDKFILNNILHLYPSKKTKSNKNYFNDVTEQAIILYNSLPDNKIEEKNIIYQNYIHPAFFKLTQNLIHTFKYYHTEVDNIEDLQHETIIFLLSKLNKFDPFNGAKAYSYFGTVAKRYLILSNAKVYKKKLDISPIEDISQEKEYSYYLSNSSESSIDKLSLFMDQFVTYCTENIYTIFPKEQDAKIADAALELFRKRDKLEVFNKKALYIFIREQIDVKTPKITKVVDKLYEIFKRNYTFYIENGYIKFS